MEPLAFHIPDLIARAMRRHLTAEQARSRIQQVRGLIPIMLLPEARHRILWMDVGDFRFTEWKFRYSILSILKESPTPEVFTTDLSLLAEPAPGEPLQPTGFIFQMSRCGSTLLGRALSSHPGHVVLNEGTPLHEPLWQYLTDDWQHPPARDAVVLRNLILALGRQRSAESDAFFIKFRSWNIIFIDALTRAFPDVPCMFLYRNPAEVMISALTREPTAYLRFMGTPAAAFITGLPLAQAEQQQRAAYYTSLYTAYFRAALDAETRLTVLNYRKLSKENFPDILRRAFSYTVPPEELAPMLEQFSYYSKDSGTRTRFTADTERKRQAVTPEIEALLSGELSMLYDRLERSERNLFPEA